MRIRRLTVVFWSTCIFAFIFILYVVTDLTLKLPNMRPAKEIDDTKWTSFESKLRHIENELNQHHAVVGEIKSAVDQIVQLDKSQQQQQQQPLVQLEPIQPVLQKKKYRDFVEEDNKVPVNNERVTIKVNMSHCPIRKDVAPIVDIQMLSTYERILFDDIDGGVWKQGWNIEYDQKQWSQAHKLQVFIVPHSHNDPGWIKTFENYYKTQTKAIFSNMVESLPEVPGRKFIWCETSYLYLWWTTDASDKEKATFIKLLKSGNIEIVTGGWVMNDEAGSHWLSIIQQLTTGHQWLLDNLQYIPKNGWAIDPFGYSSSQPYLLKLAGMENSVIQRVHYRIKKELGQNRQLEFKWRQLWDGVGKTDMFTHMMPFYSYDVPHTCGPDPKVCCQFDFKRLPGNGVTCPWGIPPKKIIQKNVAERSGLILDQWRKKAQLYRTNVVMIPLGDDFRYDSANEWDNQYRNYEMIIDYINNNAEWNTEVQFGTLEDYFRAVHTEVKLSEFPVLSGDFFTYADRGHHYWSGYFTSRPFYKNMDRVLLAYVRAAESIISGALVGGAVQQLQALQLRDRAELARRALALFQHHDGVPGTARDDVMRDYANKMLQAIKYCQSAIQHAAYFLLKEPRIQEQSQEDIFFDVDDLWRKHDEIPGRITVALDAMSPSRRILLYNALAFQRTEILTVLVSSPDVEVFDPSGKPMMAQLSPAMSGDARLGFAANKFQLSFPVTVPRLGLVAYSVALRDPAAINKYTSYARVRIYNADYWTVELPKMFAVEQGAARLSDDVTLQPAGGEGEGAGAGARLVFDRHGMLKAVRTHTGAMFPLAMEFVQYDSEKKPDNNSGAYLFIPSGPAQQFRPNDYPEMVITEGPFKATLYSYHVSPKAAEVMMAVSAYNNPSLPQTEVEVTNTLLLDPAADDIELAMRLSTRVKNGDVFYTDLNGMQMIKRRYFEKLPLQANFYPLSAAAYIEDAEARLTLLTSTPLGLAALQPGQMEVMQDRRLSRDDNRGMNQGVLDNVRTRHSFRLLVESAARCEKPTHPEHPSGQLSLGAHVSQQLLLQPLVVMHYSSREAPPPAADAPPTPADVVLASFHSHVSAKNADGKIMKGIGLTFHRVDLDMCYGNKDISKWYPIGDGQVQISDYVDAEPSQMYESSLTFNQVHDQLTSGVLAVCPMEVRAIFVNKYISSKQL